MACAFVPRTCPRTCTCRTIHASHSHPSQLLACLPESPGNSAVRALHPSIFATCSFDIPRSILGSSTSKHPYPIPRRKYTNLSTRSKLWLSGRVSEWKIETDRETRNQDVGWVRPGANGTPWNCSLMGKILNLTQFGRIN
jgi:hypothetical protein